MPCTRYAIQSLVRHDQLTGRYYDSCFFTTPIQSKGRDNDWSTQTIVIGSSNESSQENHCSIQSRLDIGCRTILADTFKLTSSKDTNSYSKFSDKETFYLFVI